MNLNKTVFRSSILSAALALGGMTSLLAGTPSGAALPEDPTHGSIRVGDDELDSHMAKRAKLSQAEAEHAATRKIPGKVIGSELGEENQFLVWDVKVLAKDGSVTQVAVDAGDGRILAMETED
jgi:uncharacterized membrane protein YkoI